MYNPYGEWQNTATNFRDPAINHLGHGNNGAAQSRYFEVYNLDKSIYIYLHNLENIRMEIVNMQNKKQNTIKWKVSKNDFFS